MGGPGQHQRASNNCNNSPPARLHACIRPCMAARPGAAAAGSRPLLPHAGCGLRAAPCPVLPARPNHITNHKRSSTHTHTAHTHTRDMMQLLLASHVCLWGRSNRVLLHPCGVGAGGGGGGGSPRHHGKHDAHAVLCGVSARGVVCARSRSTAKEGGAATHQWRAPGRAQRSCCPSCCTTHKAAPRMGERMASEKEPLGVVMDIVYIHAYNALGAGPPPSCRLLLLPAATAAAAAADLICHARRRPSPHMMHSRASRSVLL